LEVTHEKLKKRDELATETAALAATVAEISAQPADVQSSSLPIISTKLTGRRFDREVVYGIQSQVKDFNLRGGHVDKVLLCTMSLISGMGAASIERSSMGSSHR